METLLTVLQLSEWLQVKPSTVYKWMHYGYVPSVRLGFCVRFKAEKITRWLKKREVRGRNVHKIQV